MKKEKDTFYDSGFTKKYINLPITFFHHYINVAKKNMQEPCVFVRTHNHAEIELLYFKQGTGTLLLGADKKKVPFQPGDLLVINPFELHEGNYDSSVTEQEHLVVDFSPSLIDLSISKQAQQIAYDLLMQNIRCNNRITKGDPRYSEIIDCFLNIYNQTSHEIEDEFAFFSCLFSLFSVLKQENYFHQSNKSNNNESNLQFIANVLDYMELHYSEEITTQDVARSTGYSTEHFCRLFKGLFNTRFSLYLMQFRIEKAKQLLPMLSIIEISERCGFSSQSNFTRAFRKTTGISPTDFKRNGKSMLKKCN